MRRHFICTNHSIGDNDQSIHTGKAWDWSSQGTNRGIHLTQLLSSPGQPTVYVCVRPHQEPAIFCHEISCGVRNIVPNAAKLLAVKNTAAVTACPAQGPSCISCRQILPNAGQLLENSRCIGPRYCLYQLPIS